MKRLLSLLVALLLTPSLAIALTQSQVPPKFGIPWGNSAGSSYIRSIPTPSQIGIQNCAASLTDGFPALTFLPAAGGGCPPFGQDFNGILKQLSQWNQWQSAGAPNYYDAGFSTSIGGYPKGTILGAAATNGNFWLSTVDNNASDPDTGGGNWTGFTILKLANGVSAGTYTRPKETVDATGRVTSITSGAAPTFTSLTTPGSGTYTPPAGVVRIKVRMGGAGGGGGGTGNGVGGSDGGIGGTSNLGSWTAIGGQGGTLGGVSTGGGYGCGGTGGANGTGSLIVRLAGSCGGSGWVAGNTGGASVSPSYGGIGASGPFGGGTSGGGAGIAPAAPMAGGNGGGGQMVSNQHAGGGGGVGEYVEFQVTSPGSLSYTVGAPGTAGNTAGTNAGSISGPGIILIEEFYD